MNMFNHYTGNPMINNALMTIKALARLSSISELTTEKLRELFLRIPINKGAPYSLMELNLRFKCYTMLFSRNGPLYNDQNTGKDIYQRLILKIIDNFENEGKYTCDISGLKYNRTFTDLFTDTFKELHFSDKDIKKRDLTINRNWFPLLGGLGSDAQSLPMAKYTYNVHPILIVILQFLPLSATIYRRGVLLVDSSNTEFCETYIAQNVTRIIEHIGSIPSTEDIENRKDDSKGNYLLQILSTMASLELDYSYIDINLWSFSNSGAGASCSIDRLPNSLLIKLKKLHSILRDELKVILNNPSVISEFLRSLDASDDWFGLYPAKKFDGVSVLFFETYWEVIGRPQQKDYAKYIAYLISVYKSKSFEKILLKTDVYKNENYKDDLNAVLVAATKDGKWSFAHQLAIQSDRQSIPIRYGCWNLYKLIHFYYWKNEFSKQIPTIEKDNSPVASVSRWVASLIEKDERKEVFIKSLTSVSDYYNVSLNELFIRHNHEVNTDINQLFAISYDEYGNYKCFGLLSLLRFYCVEANNHRPAEPNEEDIHYILQLTPPVDFKQWFTRINQFTTDYLEYRCEDIDDNRKSTYMIKILKGIPGLKGQKIWFDDILYNLNQYNESHNKPAWREEDILFDPMGNFKFQMALLVIRTQIHKSISIHSSLM